MLRSFASLSLALVAIPASLLVAPRPAHADSCTPASVMVVLDKSSSMQTGTIAGATKWDIAVQGLGQVLSAYQTKAEFGLMTFPKPSQCGPGSLDVAPALTNRDSILASLSSPPPAAGNWTPMAQTLVVAASEPTLVQAAGARHVVLITDGWQWCSPYDPATRYDGVDAIAELNAAGVTTWIVGFGGEVDASALNRMAVAANTARPGCDPTNTDPAAPNQCYFQVDNASELVIALTAIAGTIADEICDGVDNDCDGQIDEDLTRDCSAACGAGTETCHAGSWQGCDAPAATTEVCDGVDNDCDGDVDNGAQCGDGEVCMDGSCQPPNGEVTGTPHGCDCSSSSGPDAGAFAPFVVLGLALFGRRRRRG
jgi:MYXO-CTERM domain-containing protein